MDMATIYNQETFQKFRALAVTKIEDIEFGKTYYTNTWPESFVAFGLLTSREHYENVGLEYTHSNGDKIAWIVTDPTDPNSAQSLADLNVTASYNPWLIFANEEDAIACRKELEVSYSRNDYWDDYPESED
jgi:hypothetical protein